MPRELWPDVAVWLVGRARMPSLQRDSRYCTSSYVRDLLVEPRRFGELLITLGGVNPKVLTDLGRELRPVIDALVAWGMRLSAAAGRRP